MGKVRGQDDTDPSHARDHLANERTYLAWLRTSANVMALGLAAAKFTNTATPGHWPKGLC